MGNSKKKMTIGILTAGGDCPGLNAAIRGVGKTAMLEYGMKVLGVSSGFTGLIENDIFELQENHLSGILTLGGTILGTSREKPFKDSKHYKNSINKPEIIKKHYLEHHMDCLVCIGGNGTMNTAAKLVTEGLNIVGIPKTIDNDIWGTDISFGFDSALNIATEAIDRLHTTANSHKRTMVIEVMGHNAGWLALYSGIAGGGDIILIPEIEYDLDKIAECLNKRISRNKTYSIIVAAEGIKKPKGVNASQFVAENIAQKTGYETRETVLGYIQRGGTPSPADRVLATRLGTYAAELISEQRFGIMVGIRDNQTSFESLEKVAGKVRLVPKDYELIRIAKKTGTCFGD